MDICHASQLDEISNEKTGVYLIYFKNSQNNKKYVGSTSVNEAKFPSGNGFRHRWIGHLCKLRKGTGGIKLQNAYNKYSEVEMVFEAEEICDPKDCLIREQYYIDKYDSYHNGYNSSPVAGSQLGYKHTEETKQKIISKRKEKRDIILSDVLSLYKDGKNCKEIASIVKKCHSTIAKILKESGTYIRKRADYIKIKIYQYSSECKFLKEWSSIYECDQETGIHESCIRRSLKLYSKTGNFYFTYIRYQENDLLQLINKIKLERKTRVSKILKATFTPDRLRKMSEASKGNNFHKKIEKIKQFDLDRNLIKIWDNSKELVAFYKLKNFSPIGRVLRGLRKKFKGFYWSL